MTANRGHAPRGHPAYEGSGRTKIYTTEFIENEADEFIKWIKNKDKKTYYFKDFARDRGYTFRMLSLWAKENAKFSDAYEQALDWQESILMNGSLTKKLFYPTCALILANSHGIIAKQETKHSGDSFHTMLEAIDGKTRDILDE